MSGLVPVLPSEAALSWSISLWHWELTTGLNIPTIIIQSPSLFQFEAGQITSVIGGKVEGSLQLADVREIEK